MVDDLTLRSFINIHLLNSIDGSPHQVPLQKVIKLNLGRHRDPRAVSMCISGSRVALLFDTAMKRRRKLIVWDWRTGNAVGDFSSWRIDPNPTSIQVFKHSSDDLDIGSAISWITHMRFLGGSWLLALTRGRPPPQLLVLNTRLSRRDRRSWRILDLPPHSSPTDTYLIYTQHEKSPAECPELSVDPAQKTFVVWSRYKQAFIVPVKLLVQHMCSERVRLRIPWDEWGGDLVTVHLPPDTRGLQLVDTKLLALRGFMEGWSGVEVYDLSRLSLRDIQVRQVSEGANRRCRRVLSTPKWLARYQTRNIDPFTIRLVGSKVVSVIVSLLRVHSACAILNVTLHRIGHHFLAESVFYVYGG